jgi:hypothetical protein
VDQDTKQEMEAMFTHRYFNEKQKAFFRKVMKYRAELYSSPRTALLICCSIKSLKSISPFFFIPLFFVLFFVYLIN